MARFYKWFNGIGKSRADQSGLDAFANCDVHNEIGFLQPQIALELEDDANAPDEKVNMCNSPSGTIYAFSRESGKIWKYTSGAWSTITANSNATGHRGCKYFENYIYYATSSKLGRFVVETEASKNDTYHTFGNTSNYKPMEVQNLQLFIGNARYLTSINSSGTVTDNALDLPRRYPISALIGAGGSLLIGTITASNVNDCKVFLWDTYSDSWTLEDAIPENSVNCFMAGDNIIFAQCGTAGQLYYWNGNRLEKFKKIRGTTPSQSQPQNWTVLSGRVLFGADNKVFSIHREDNDLVYAVVQEYTSTVNGNIYSMASVGSELLLSQDDGIDKTGTNYATATVDTPEIEGPFSKVVVYYDALPSGTTIGISTKVDGGSWTEQTAITDTIKKKVYFDGGLNDCNFVQARATLTPSGTDKPVIRSIEIL